ncbi:MULTISPECIES: hypothetical protein [unclassified Cryobacterium]|uniref:hypothetical protein n=1 Tax=unclassified Cryobacterium TaxID=2649013 RepID=UPI0011B0D882|nr:MULTISPECIES: hypothetical protein [unclassified Cryobacterium]
MSEAYEVELGESWRSRLEGLLFEDLDHEFLFDESLDGIEDDPELGPPGMCPMSFENWFIPFDVAYPTSPYPRD